VKRWTNKALHSVQRAQTNISERKDQCAFGSGETVAALAAVSPGVAAARSHALLFVTIFFRNYF